MAGALLLLGGCNCDLDSCSSSQSPSQSTYQEPSRQASAGVDLSSYGMYSGVRIPAKPPSQQTEPAIPSTAYQAPAAGDSKPAGFIPPPIVKGGCQTTGAAEYDPATNTIHLCVPLTPAQERYTVVHETAHAVDFQEDGEFEADPEYWADQYAVNLLLQKSDCEAIEARAVSPITIKDAYTRGILYAREMYALHCR